MDPRASTCRPRARSCTARKRSTCPRAGCAASGRCRAPWPCRARGRAASDDMHGILVRLAMRKERHGPRSLRFLLEPDKPVKVLIEPWNEVLGFAARFIGRGGRGDPPLGPPPPCHPGARAAAGEIGAAASLGHRPAVIRGGRLRGLALHAGPVGLDGQRLVARRTVRSAGAAPARGRGHGPARVRRIESPLFRHGGRIGRRDRTSGTLVPPRSPPTPRRAA